jgi:hypothetical protein
LVGIRNKEQKIRNKEVNTTPFGKTSVRQTKYSLPDKANRKELKAQGY